MNLFDIEELERHLMMLMLDGYITLITLKVAPLPDTIPTETTTVDSVVLLILITCNPCPRSQSFATLVAPTGASRHPSVLKTSSVVYAFVIQGSLSSYLCCCVQFHRCYLTIRFFLRYNLHRCCEPSNKGSAENNGHGQTT